MTALRPAWRKLLAFSLLSVLIGMVWLVVVVPVSDRFASYDQQITQSQALLARYGRVVRSRSVLEKELDQVRRNRIVNDGFYRERSVELAAASIQQVVQKSVVKNGSQLASVQVLPVQDENGFQKIGVRVRMAGTVGGLRDTLYELETAWPLLFTDNVNVEVRRMRRRQGQRTTPDGEDLRIQFDVYGYLGKGTGQMAKAGQK